MVMNNLEEIIELLYRTGCGCIICGWLQAFVHTHAHTHTQARTHNYFHNSIDLLLSLSKTSYGKTDELKR